MPRRKEPRIPDAILDQLLAGADPKTAFDPNGLLDELKKALAERALNAEMDHHLGGEEGAGNSRNGYGRKTVVTDTGRIELEVPRDRQASFDPQLIAKYQRRFPGFDDKIVSIAAIIAVAVDPEGRREIVGLHLGPSEAETFWSTLLKGLVKRGLRGVKLVASDAHEGLKAAIRRVLGATWQRCRVHWMRNVLAYVPKGQQTMAAAALRQAFLQPDQESARRVWRQVADQLRPRWPKLAAFMDDSEHDVLAYLGFPAQHRTKLHSTNPLERLNKEVKRRADVVGIFPNEAAITRLIGAVLLEANDEWQLRHRYMQVEPMAELATPAADIEAAQIPPQAA